MSADDQLKQEPSPAQDPRLGIRHLMLWTALSAAVISLFIAGESLPEDQAGLATFYLMSKVAEAAAWTVVVTRFVWYRRLGLPWLHQPGHGVALLVTLASVQNSVLRALARLYAASLQNGYVFIVGDDGLSEWLLFAMQYGAIVAALMSSVVAVAFGILFVERWRWRSFFFAVPLASCAGFVTHLLLAWTSAASFFDTGLAALIGFWPQIALLLLLVAASVSDRRRRGWTHWWGVAAFAVSIAFSFATYAFILATGGFTAQ